MIKVLDGKGLVFVLETENTSYIISKTESGHLEHLFYGSKITLSDDNDCDIFIQKREFEIGNGIRYSNEHPSVYLEDMCLEMSSFGHGDIREPFVEIIRENGSRSCDFIYSSYEISDTKEEFSKLPGSYSEDGKVEHLCLKLKDRNLELELHYYIYPGCDVITRSSKLINRSDENIILKRLMSTQIDFPFCGSYVTSFHGAWAREMTKYTSSITVGKFVMESRCGISSNRTNPFFMVHSPQTDEHNGSCYGFNLVYSANHYSAVEVNAYGKTRIVTGIQPDGFSCLLKPGRFFEAPEAVMTYSSCGFSGQSMNMHRFVNEHIIRGEWKKKVRPVLLNSWEACYFNISEPILLSLAKNAKALGIELLVIDDGWFGDRKDDLRSLGDWDENLKKLPHGLKGLSDKLKAMKMKLGIWVEPEMVNTDSNLYREHPDWAVYVPDSLHSEGRNQRILDLANPKVVEYIKEKMTSLLSKADISYVKWDMNRIFSDLYSNYLEPERQGEFTHRYICGLYSIMKSLTERFPGILFEGCASGGNRFDLGILSYFPQIWASDNTDALSRAHIQEGYSYGYPQSTYTCHVSASPNHQTLRVSPHETRFNIASFGILGYECDVRFFTPLQRKLIREEIMVYKKLRAVFQYGQFYRISGGNVHEWICVSNDKKRAVGMLMQEMVIPNTQAHRFYPCGLDPDLKYHFYSLGGLVDIRIFGSLINAVSPVHVKQDSSAHNLLSKVVKVKREVEDSTAFGKTMMKTGITLKQQFSGNGFNENVRVFTDCSSRLYFFEAVE